MPDSCPETECDCYVTTSRLVGNTIHYCQLHKAAPALLEALQNMLKRCLAQEKLLIYYRAGTGRPPEMALDDLHAIVDDVERSRAAISQAVPEKGATP